MISKAPGVEDLFPDRIERWNLIIDAAREVFRLNNYKEIIIPIMEFTEVFTRGLGEETDIVTKEMFTFEDRGGRSLTLRPEGTASVVRAYVENGEYNRLSTCKFFYIGAMFRAERPQRGRLRQFNQFGAELFGSGNPFYDYEIISLIDSIVKRIGLKNYYLLINSIGCHSCRSDFIEELKKYYSGKIKELCNDCKKRLLKNPLRILDCKNESCKELKKDSPTIKSYLCEECKSHHNSIMEYLTDNSIIYSEDPHLVRGLDYYTKTTFEFVSDKLGGQNAFAAGGRYDNLVEVFNGKPTPAVGFAAGIERIMLLIEEKEIESSGLDVFIVHTGGETMVQAASICSFIRQNGYSADLNPGSIGFKPQFKKADRENATLALIIGEDELSAQSCTIKDLTSGKQERIKTDNVIEYLKLKLG